MDLSTIIQNQISADRRRGFPVDFVTDFERVAQLEKDLIGLFGEVGEFANLLKKVRLTLAHAQYAGPSLEEVAPALREELADAFIYLIRLSVLVGGNLETDIMNKMRVNDSRYSKLEER